MPKRLFKLKAKELYAEWLIHNPTEPENQLRFGSQWIKEWEDEYGVSLRKPNKRFSIKKEDLVTRIEDYLQNVWTVWNFFIKKYGIDPPVINGDKMPMHCNGNASQETLAFKGLDTYGKENYMLSCERAIVFTQTSSSSSIDLKPEFVFKGKGTRTKLNPPSGIKFQWSESGSYRIDQLKQTIMNLPNRFNPFTCKNFAIYVLHDYAVHLMPEVLTSTLETRLCSHNHWRWYYRLYTGK